MDEYSAGFEKWRIAFSEAFSALLTTLYPPHCILCGEYEPALLCEVCSNSLLTPLPLPICMVCGRSLDENGVCWSCRRKTPSFTRARAAGVFTGDLRTIIHILKFRGAPQLAQPLGEILARFIRQVDWSEDEPTRFDLVTSVPMSPSRQWTRGYNQADRLAKVVAHQLELPYKNDLIVRTRSVRPQVGLSRSERQDNMDEVFEKGEARCRGRRVLLIDDVSTTGATLDACASALKSAGAAAVYGATLADGV
jgi:ComF family protein